eukprot:9498302-Pyramimonas_sp.AAC.1
MITVPFVPRCLFSLGPHRPGLGEQQGDVWGAARGGAVSCGGARVVQWRHGGATIGAVGGAPDGATKRARGVP